jgi:hypothetical protein
MQNLMAALALGLAGLILGWSWWTVLARHRPAMAARGRDTSQDEPIEAPVKPSPTPWFAPPSNPVLELKAARIRTGPAAAPEPVAQIGRRAGWTAEDDAELLRLLGENVPAVEIAMKLGRSEKAVQLRIPLLRLRQREAERMASTAKAADAA